MTRKIGNRQAVIDAIYDTKVRIWGRGSEVDMPLLRGVEGDRLAEVTS
jgi:hypothetical protein